MVKLPFLLLLSVPVIAPALHAGYPSSFEPNRGQADRSVSFVARVPGTTAWISADRASLRGASLRFVGANVSVPAEGLRPLPHRTSYFVGRRRDQWRTGVPNYERVRFRDVYRGIDVVWHADHGSLEYDLILAPGADPDQIRIQFDGARKARLSEEGDLLIETRHGELRQCRPRVFQADSRTPIDAGYKMMPDGRVAIRLGAYHRSQSVVIDPALTYSTYLSGSSLDRVTSVGLDGVGNLYVALYTESNELSNIEPGFRTSTGGGDIMVLKIDSTKRVVWAAVLGGRGVDYASSLAVGQAGEVFLAGSTESTDFPATAGAFQRAFGGGRTDGFVAKLAATGDALNYATLLGGSGNDSVWDMAVDRGGFAYLASFCLGDFPATPGALRTSGTVCVSKLDPSGDRLIYSARIGSGGLDYANSIAVDDAGNAYVVGQTPSQNFPTTPGAYSRSYAGGANDAFLFKLNPEGSSLVFSTLLGGTGGEWSRAVKVSPDGSIVMLGGTNSNDFPVTTTAAQKEHAGGGDYFLAKLDSKATRLLYSTYLGGAGGDGNEGDLALDATGGVYVVGDTGSPDFPVTPDALARCGVGAPRASDTFLARLDLNKSGPAALTFSTCVGASPAGAWSVAFDQKAAAVWIGGSTHSQNLPITGSAIQSAPQGPGESGFLARYGFSAEIAAVVNAASNQPLLAPGALASVYGTNLATLASVFSNFTGTKGPRGSPVGVTNIGYNFVVPPESDFVFTGGAYLASLSSGTNAFDLALRLDSGGSPGSVLESINLAEALTSSVAAVPFWSRAFPTLLAGHQYWLTAARTEPSAPGLAWWWPPSPSDSGLAASSLNGGPWSVATNAERGAFRILGYPRASAVPLPTRLGGVTLTLGGRPAPLLYVSPSQINFQVPYDTPPGSSKLVVSASGTDGSVSANVTVTAAAPGIFVYGENWAVIQNQDYSVNGPSNPAKAGTYVTLYGTGVGLVSPVVQTGDAAPSSPLAYAATEVTASINGMPAAVVFAGLSPGNIGLLQVNVRIPALPSGIYRIQITAGGVTSNAPSVAVVE